jgi:hypothetical protein
MQYVALVMPKVCIERPLPEALIMLQRPPYTHYSCTKRLFYECGRTSLAFAHSSRLLASLSAFYKKWRALAVKS